jgi:hypothetical protein
VDCGTVGNINPQIRPDRQVVATHVALRPVHANGDYAARDAVLEVMTDLWRSAGFNRQELGRKRSSAPPRARDETLGDRAVRSSARSPHDFIAHADQPLAGDAEDSRPAAPMENQFVTASKAM